MKNHPLLNGYLFALAATAIWSGNFIIARDLIDNIPPVSLAFWRWVIAIAVFLPFALKPVIEERHILKQHLPYLLMVSLLGVTTFNTFIYIAGHTTTAINLSLISITFPIFIILLSRLFYKELISARKALGILLVATGIVFLISKGQLAELQNIQFAVGDIWMLFAAIAFAIYSILLKRKPKQLSIWALHGSTFVIGLVFLLPFYLWETASSPNIEWNLKTLTSIAYIGVFASVVAFILWNKAIINIGPAKAGVTYYTLPLFSGAAAYLYLDESITTLHLVSGILIIVGILIANYDVKSPKLNRKPN